MWSASRKTAGPFGVSYAADALEDAGAVVETVDADVNGRVRPVDELAVHPDLRGLLHHVLRSRAFVELWGFQHNVLDPSRVSGGRAPAVPASHDVRLGACARPDGAVAEQRPLDEHDRDALEREGRHGPRARTPSPPRPRAARATVTRRASTSRATLPVSALRSPGTSTTTGVPSQTRTSRLHDLPQRAARPRRPRQRRSACRRAAPRAAPRRRCRAGTRRPARRARPFHGQYTPGASRDRTRDA